MTSDLHRSSASPTRDRIRVAFLIHTLESGGAEGQLVEWIRGLPTDRFECRVICLVRGGFHEETVRSLGAAIDILGYSPMRRSDGSLEWGGLLSFVPAFIRLVRILRRFRPHVLQTVLLMSDFMGALATLFTGRPRIRLVGSRRSLTDCSGLGGLRGAAVRFAVRKADTILCNSRAVADDVVRHQGADPKRIVVIHNGVDVGRFESARENRDALRASLGLAPSTAAIGCVAQLRPEKDHESLLHAIARVRKVYSDTVLLLVGSGPREQSIRQLSVALSLGEAVRFLGVRKDVADLMASFDLLTLPSRSEGFSNVILEGMASGLPVVATRVGGNIEALADGKYGVLVPPGDANQLSDAIANLLRNRDSARELGRAAQRHARDNYSLESLHRETRKFYERMASA